eukprot:gnl/MRDRNA2_/MRDRNA2_31347_c0_seq1.p1 gnl/MRDRNA2_/MRDRNA2_31347_c0~~gnl/MRDRNA2_/MRDRNA2_31347_c0_seq1.p1  ORF type:complete len:468 (-),score=89.63 gnl/MRDRNA2_/MRDRNA2_31347_c0_seq1:432-1835(-)
MEAHLIETYILRCYRRALVPAEDISTIVGINAQLEDLVKKSLADGLAAVVRSQRPIDRDAPAVTIEQSYSPTSPMAVTEKQSNEAGPNANAKHGEAESCTETLANTAESSTHGPTNGQRGNVLEKSQKFSSPKSSSRFRSSKRPRKIDSVKFMSVAPQPSSAQQFSTEEGLPQTGNGIESEPSTPPRGVPRGWAILRSTVKGVSAFRRCASPSGSTGRRRLKMEAPERSAPDTIRPNDVSASQHASHCLLENKQPQEQHEKRKQDELEKQLQELQEKQAATKIQSVYRGSKARSQPMFTDSSRSVASDISCLRPSPSELRNPSSPKHAQKTMRLLSETAPSELEMTVSIMASTGDSLPRIGDALSDSPARSLSRHNAYPPEPLFVPTLAGAAGAAWARQVWSSVEENYQSFGAAGVWNSKATSLRRYSQSIKRVADPEAWPPHACPLPKLGASEKKMRPGRFFKPSA